jgi:hypothetical protein
MNGTNPSQDKPMDRMEARKAHVLDARVVEALDQGDFDLALEQWVQAESHPGETEEPAGPQADALVANLPAKGLSAQDQAAHQVLSACPDALPLGGGVEGLRIWMRERGIEASTDYTRHLWRQISAMATPVDNDTLVLAAREHGPLPPPPPEPPKPEGPVR